MISTPEICSTGSRCKNEELKTAALKRGDDDISESIEAFMMLECRSVRRPGSHCPWNRSHLATFLCISLISFAQLFKEHFVKEWHCSMRARI